jgi:hypothetical protein
MIMVFVNPIMVLEVLMGNTEVTEDNPCGGYTLALNQRFSDLGLK